MACGLAPQADGGADGNRAGDQRGDLPAHHLGEQRGQQVSPGGQAQRTQRRDQADHPAAHQPGQPGVHHRQADRVHAGDEEDGLPFHRARGLFDGQHAGEDDDDRPRQHGQVYRHAQDGCGDARQTPRRQKKALALRCTGWSLRLGSSTMKLESAAHAFQISRFAGHEQRVARFELEIGHVGAVAASFAQQGDGSEAVAAAEIQFLERAPLRRWNAGRAGFRRRSGRAR